MVIWNVNNDDNGDLPIEEVNGEYVAKRPLKRHEILKFARSLSIRKFQEYTLFNITCSKAFLREILPLCDCEIFYIILLDKANRVIKVKELFRGTIDKVSIYKREIVKEILDNCAMAVLFAHNHFGNSQPSSDDIKITKELNNFLHIINVRLIDHLIITGDDMVSMAELGLI